MLPTFRRGAPAVLALLAVATIVLAGQAAWAADGSGADTPAPVTATATPAPDPVVTPAPAPTTGPVAAAAAAADPAPASQQNLQLPPAGLTNTPPVAHDDAFSTEENTALNLIDSSFLANDTDADGDTLSVVDPTGPTAHGYLSHNGGGQYLYKPDSGFTGTDSFTYFANDGQADSLSPATVTITVKFTPGINHAPIAVGDSYVTPLNTPLVLGAPGIYANDSDPDGDPLVGNQVISLPKHGVLTASSDGSITYVPFLGFSGTDSFVYLVSDGQLFSNAPGQVAILVAGPVVVPDPIHAVDDAFTMAMNTGLSVSAPGVTSNDTDNVPMNVQGITIGTSTLHGALTHGTHGEFSYIPNPGFVGTDTFTYSAFNGVNSSNFATVTITVTDPGVPPVTTPTPTPSAGGGDPCHDITGAPLASCDPPSIGDPCKDITGAPLASCASTTRTRLASTGVNTAPMLELAASLLLLGIAGLGGRAIARKVRRRSN